MIKLAKTQHRHDDHCEIYCTSFCNFGHRLCDGKPIDHECYVIPPVLLMAERAGTLDRTAWQTWSQGSRRKSSGVWR